MDSEILLLNLLYKQNNIMITVSYLMVALLIVILFLNVPYITGRIVSENETKAIDSWLIGTTMITLISVFVYLMYVLVSLFLNIIPQ